MNVLCKNFIEGYLKVKNKHGLSFLAASNHRRVIRNREREEKKMKRIGKTKNSPVFRERVSFSKRCRCRSVTPEANSDEKAIPSVYAVYAPLGNWKPLLENETSLPTSWSAAIIHVRLFLHCVRVWLQVFRATSLKVFLALSLSFTFAFSFLYSFYSLFPWITNTLVSRRQGSRIETRRSSPHRKTGCVHPRAVYE